MSPGKKSGPGTDKRRRSSAVEHLHGKEEVRSSNLRDGTSSPSSTRGTATGRYSFSSRMERLCVCGHSLSVHAGEPPHDCLNEDAGCGGDGAPCPCGAFKLARKR